MTNEQRIREAAALGVMAAIGDCLRSLGEVPAGEFYARLMAMQGFSHLTADKFNGIIDVFVKVKLVDRTNHLLTWVGPKEEK